MPINSIPPHTFCRKIDLTGQRFSKLLVLKENPMRGPHSIVRWDCICDCGCRKTIHGDQLRRGVVVSCGCWSRERLGNASRTHGMTNTRLYRIWCNMKNRCTNPRATQYYAYGARGITICESWLDSFEIFLHDMGPSYGDGLTLDRIDNNGPYSPENCHWVDLEYQANNKRNNRMIIIGTESHTAAEWSRLTGINSYTIRSRLQRGWTPDRALSQSVRQIKASHT